MSAAFFIYLVEVLSGISVLAVILGIAGLIASFFYLVFYAIEYEKYHGKHWTLIAPMVAFLVAIVIPSSKTMYMMAGAVLAEKAIESEIGQQVLDVIKFKLDEELQKLKGEKK